MWCDQSLSMKFRTTKMYKTSIFFLFLIFIQLITCLQDFRVKEEQPINTRVGFFRVPSNFTHHRFTILPNDNLFTIDNFLIFTNSPIDRDQMCLYMDSCTKIYSVYTQQDLLVDKIRITIEDINDNPPTFQQPSPFKFAVSESSSLFFQRLPHAIDSDAANNGKISYQLLPLLPNDIPHFFLERIDHDDVTHTLTLNLKRPLDREVQETHSMILVARDQGEPAKSSSLKIDVQVIDANDNLPTCSQKLFTFKVSENMRDGSFVGVVTASDPDQGLNSKLTYVISPDSDPWFQKLLQVDEKSGEMRTERVVDYEEIQEMRGMIKVSDSGYPALTSDCAVVVEVEDVNDNRPTILITSKDGSRLDTIEISENLNTGYHVARIAVTDADDPQHTRVSCYLEPRDLFKLRLIETSDHTAFYDLITAVSFNREVFSTTSFNIQCSDDGVVPLDAVAEITVQILDVNDNAPVFESTHYSVSVQENSIPTTPLIKIKAHDPDAGSNGEMQYSIKAVDQRYDDFLRVDGEGLIIVERPFDSEVDVTVNFHIEASDKGSPSLSRWTGLQVTVLDVDDVPPRFEQHSYHFEVKDEVKKAHVIGTIKATDDDFSKPYKQIMYKICQCEMSGEIIEDENMQNIKEVKRFLNVDQVTGVIRVRMSVEVLKKFKFCVSADSPSQRWQEHVKTEVHVEVGLPPTTTSTTTTTTTATTITTTTFTTTSTISTTTTTPPSTTASLATTTQSTIKANILTTTPSSTSVATETTTQFEVEFIYPNPNNNSLMLKVPPDIQKFDICQLKLSNTNQPQNTNSTYIFRIEGGNEKHILHLDSHTGLLTADLSADNMDHLTSGFISLNISFSAENHLGHKVFSGLYLQFYPYMDPVFLRDDDDQVSLEGYEYSSGYDEDDDSGNDDNLRDYEEFIKSKVTEKKTTVLNEVKSSPVETSIMKKKRIRWVDYRSAILIVTICLVSGIFFMIVCCLVLVIKTRGNKKKKYNCKKDKPIEKPLPEDKREFMQNNPVNIGSLFNSGTPNFDKMVSFNVDDDLPRACESSLEPVKYDIPLMEESNFSQSLYSPPLLNFNRAEQIYENSELQELQKIKEKIHDFYNSTLFLDQNPHPATSPCRHCATPVEFINFNSFKPANKYPSPTHNNFPHFNTLNFNHTTPPNFQRQLSQPCTDHIKQPSFVPQNSKPSPNKTPVNPLATSKKPSKSLTSSKNNTHFVPISSDQLVHQLITTHSFLPVSPARPITSQINQSYDTLDYPQTFLMESTC